LKEGEGEMKPTTETESPTKVKGKSRVGVYQPRCEECIYGLSSNLKFVLLDEEAIRTVHHELADLVVENQVPDGLQK